MEEKFECDRNCKLAQVGGVVGVIFIIWFISWLYFL